MRVLEMPTERDNYLLSIKKMMRIEREREREELCGACVLSVMEIESGLG
jgi:hypothetical protein